MTAREYVRLTAEEFRLADEAVFFEEPGANGSRAVAYERWVKACEHFSSSQDVDAEVRKTA